MEKLFYYVGAAVCGLGGLLLAGIMLTAWVNKFRMNATNAYFFACYMRDRDNFRRYMRAVKNKEAK
jgi:hypothetical protein